MSNRNASATVFGWDFQINAAIVLMLENIEVSNQVRVEGATEDIEIMLENGKYIYSQAKSVVNSSSDFTNVKQKMKDAIESLAEAYMKGDADKLIYVTNSPNPFNDITYSSIFYGNAKRNYYSLPDKYKEKISSIVEKLQECKTLDVNKLIIRIIPFETDDPQERYKEIKRKVDDFVYAINPYNLGMGQQILEIWQKELFENASVSNLSKCITKKDLIWPIIVLSTDIEKCDNNLIEEIDLCDYEDLVRTYKNLINSRVERFEFATKIVSDYQAFNYSGTQRTKLLEFVKLRAFDYLEELETVNIDGEIKRQLVEIILYNIIKQRKMISDIKKKVNL